MFICGITYNIRKKQGPISTTAFGFAEEKSFSKIRTLTSFLKVALQWNQFFLYPEENPCLTKD